MAQNWYLQRDGVQFGPYSQDHFVRLVRSGGETTQAIRRADRGGWTKLAQLAADYPELAPLFGGATASREPADNSAAPPVDLAPEQEPAPAWNGIQLDTAEETPEPSVIGVAAFSIGVSALVATLIVLAGRRELGPLMIVIAAAFCGLVLAGVTLATSSRTQLFASLGLVGNLFVALGLSAMLIVQGPRSLPAQGGDLAAHPNGPAFEAAVLAGDLERARALAAALPDLADDRHRLHNGALLAKVVAQQASPETIAYLLAEAHADPNAEIKFTWRGETYPLATPLLVALLTAHDSAIEPLLAAGADPGRGESPAKTPLGLAVERRDLALCKKMVEAAAGGNKTHDSLDALLVQVISEGDGAFARQLLTIGADPNLVAPEGTALQFATARGDATLVKALLENGADPNLYSAGGDATTMLPPLHRAVKFQQLEIAELLLAHKADPNMPSPGVAARTPIELADGSPALVDLLLKHGAKPGVKSEPPPPKKKKRPRQKGPLA